MHRNVTERPITGCLPVPLFNQKKRSRLPLTSNPSENEFGSNNEYSAVQNFPLMCLPPGFLGNPSYSQVPRPSQVVPTVQDSQWDRQLYLKKIPMGTTTERGLTSNPHSGWHGQIGSQTRKWGLASWQDCDGQPNAKQISLPSSQSAESSWYPSHLHLQRDQQPRKPTNPSADLRSQSPGSGTPVFGSQQQKSVWQFKSTADHSPFKRQHKDVFSKKVVSQPQKKMAEFQAKAVVENSMRVLTAVIEGMKHWSQYKDRVFFLFEIFATLDSAVTIGNHGAKTFLLRDGRDTVQCVFYETDQDLPRLIRGQVQRCMGTYDRAKDILTCVSVRQATASEQKNAQEAVKVSDMEMRRLVRSLSEL